MAQIEIEIEEELTVAKTPATQLFDFLYKVGHHALTPSISRMFNCEFSLEDTFSVQSVYFEEERTRFDVITRDGAVTIEDIKYVHFNFSTSSEKKQRLNRDWHKIQANKKWTQTCPVHKKPCRLMEYYYAFFCYLHMNIDLKDEDDEVSLPEPQKRSDEEVEKHDDTPHLIEEINVSEEKEASQLFDINELRNVGQDVSTTVNESPEESAIPTTVLPSYHVGDSEYILLTDIQHVFNMREDHCIAFIAQNLEAEQDFVDDDMDKYLVVDTHVENSEFMSAAKTLKMIFSDAHNYEGKDATEEELHAARERLGISDMGRNPAVPSVRETEGGNSTINLWQEDLLVADENQQLLVDEDDFLKRASGKRPAGLGHDSALGRYINRLKFPQVVIFHAKFSKDNANFPLLAIKTLSRYLGGYKVRLNAEKSILLERQAAVRIFGEGPGVYALRCKYFLTYAAYGLACGIRDPALLSDYGKTRLLRTAKPDAPPTCLIEQGDDPAECSSKRARLEDDNTPQE